MNQFGEAERILEEASDECFRARRLGNGLTMLLNNVILYDALPMDTMSIALPETMKHFVLERVSEV
jgi:hypothetical protein